MKTPCMFVFAALPLTNPFNKLLCVLTTNSRNSRNEPGFHLWAQLWHKREHANNRANSALFAVEDHVEQRIAYGFPCSSHGEKCLVQYQNSSWTSSDPT